MTNIIIKSALVSSSILIISALKPTAALSSGNGSEVCLNPTIKSYESGNESQMNYSDSNNIIESICIKSGSKMFDGNQHSSPLGNGTYENGCYEVSGVGTNTVTVKRLKEDNTCQGLSHLDIFTKENIQVITESKVEKRIEVITETQEVLSSNTTQLANTGIILTLTQKIIISAGLIISSLPLSAILKKRLA